MKWVRLICWGLPRECFWRLCDHEEGSGSRICNWRLRTGCKTLEKVGSDRASCKMAGRGFWLINQLEYPGASAVATLMMVCQGVARPLSAPTHLKDASMLARSPYPGLSRVAAIVVALLIVFPVAACGGKWRSWAGQPAALGVGSQGQEISGCCHSFRGCRVHQRHDRGSRRPCHWVVCWRWRGEGCVNRR